MGPRRGAVGVAPVTTIPRRPATSVSPSIASHPPISSQAGASSPSTGGCGRGSNFTDAPGGPSASHCHTRSPSQPSTRDPSARASRYRLPGATLSAHTSSGRPAVAVSHSGGAGGSVGGSVGGKDPVRPAGNDDPGHDPPSHDVSGNCPVPRTVPVSASRVQSAR